MTQPKIALGESEISLPSSIINDSCGGAAPFHTQNDSLLNDGDQGSDNSEDDANSTSAADDYNTCPPGIIDQDSMPQHSVLVDQFGDRWTDLMLKLDSIHMPTAIKTIDNLLVTAIDRYDGDRYRCRSFQLARCILQQYGIQPFQSLQVDVSCCSNLLSLDTK